MLKKLLPIVLLVFVTACCAPAQETSGSATPCAHCEQCEHCKDMQCDCSKGKECTCCKDGMCKMCHGKMKGMHHDKDGTPCPKCIKHKAKIIPKE